MSQASKHIGISIKANQQKIYDYIQNGEHLPEWASGLSSSIDKEGDAWVSDSPMGRVKIKFADRNNLGVLDHEVTTADGHTFHNPMRVFKNNDGGCEIVFTLFRQAKMTDAEYEGDVATINKDLKKLKSILE